MELDTCIRAGRTMNGKLNGVYFIPTRLTTEQIKSGDAVAEMHGRINGKSICPQSKVRSSRTLLISIVGVLAIGAGLLLWAISSMQERKSALGEMALLRTQQLVQLRLNGPFSEMAEDIREEAAAIEISDSTVVFDRWYPFAAHALADLLHHIGQRGG
ncbi:MAG: hypothetical protein IPF64_18025 [Flavobacteriales bacterium]|nr:hypothetical protein [Flavobacteriales bacterium]